MSKIHFIYNAKNDFFSIAGDFIHKSLSPKNYSCNLCKLSYGAIKKKKKWADFLHSLDYEYSFIYKNEDNSILKEFDSYPIILFESNNNIDILISKDEISICKNIESLITLLQSRIEKH